jgi:hypothetical protein
MVETWFPATSDRAVWQENTASPTDMHRTGAAQAHTTTEFRAGRLEMIAQRPEQWCIIADTDVLRFSVKG